MVKNKNNNTNVLVTDSGRGCSIAIIRSLGRAGYNVVAADSTPKSVGFRSKYVQTKLVYPSPVTDADAFVDFLIRNIQAHKIDLIIPVTDLEIQPILASRGALEKITRLALPGDESLTFVNNKRKTVELAKKLNVPVPKTFMVATSQEAITASEKMTWPVVLKPESSTKLQNGKRVESFGVCYANSTEELSKSMSAFEGRCTVLLQEYFQGVGYGIELLMYQGEVVTAFSHRRLREIPVTGGASAYRESVQLDDALYQQSLNMLKELRWTGLAMVEYKVRGRETRLMEINGRIWGSLPLAVAAGVNFPLLLAQLYLDGPDSVPRYLNAGYKTGIRCRDLQRDLMWIASVFSQRKKYPFLTIPGRIDALKALLGMFNPRQKFDLLCVDDPIPAIAEIPRIIQKFRVKARAH